MEIKTTSTGFTEDIENFKDKVPEFDPRTGDHLWAVFGFWKCNPAAMEKGEQLILDHESLLSISPPACYYCERMYSHDLFLRRCKGHP
jgi:hypothetical protein